MGRLSGLGQGVVRTVIEAPFAMSHAIHRPMRAQILYRQGGDAVWLVNSDGAQNRKLRTAAGAIGSPNWSGDGKTLDCRAVQQVFHRETRQLVVSVLVRPAPDGKSAAMVITLPLGLNLTEPVLVKVDNGAAERQSIQTCTNVGCFVAMTLTDKLIAAMRTGSDLKITVQDANKKPVEMSLPLLGFGIAFDKAK